MKKPIQPIFFIAFFAGVFALFWMSIRPSSGKALDEWVYLPHVQLDPTLTPTATSTPTPTPTATPVCNYEIIDSANEEVEDAIMAAIQQARKDEKESELTELDEIIHAARLHSRDMSINNYVGHQDSNNEYGPDRLEEVCYVIEEDQEIVWGGTIEDADALVASWLEDKFWRRAILDADMIDFGAGYINAVEGSDHPDYVTVNFGRRASARSSSLQQGDALCEIPLANESGQGVLLVRSQTVCEAYHQE